MVKDNAESLGKKLIAIKQEQRDLRQRGLNSQLHLDHMNALSQLRKELLDSQEETAKVKNAWAKATRENLHSAKYQGSSMLRATIDVTNRAFEHTNNVSRLRGAAQLAMLPIDHTQQPDVQSDLDLQEQHREISRRVDANLNILDNHLQSNRRQHLADTTLALQIQAKDNQIQQLEADLAQLNEYENGTIIAEDKQVHQLQQRLAQGTAARDQLQEELVATHLRLDESEARARTLYDQKSTALASLDIAQSRVIELREASAGHNRQYNELQLHAEELAKDCKNLRESQGELTRQIDSHKTSNAELTKQCEDQGWY